MSVIFFYINTDGLIKLIKSLSDMVVKLKSAGVGEKGCVIFEDDGLLDAGSLIRTF